MLIFIFVLMYIQCVQCMERFKIKIQTLVVIKQFITTDALPFMLTTNKLFKEKNFILDNFQSQVCVMRKATQRYSPQGQSPPQRLETHFNYCISVSCSFLLADCCCCATYDNCPRTLIYLSLCVSTRENELRFSMEIQGNKSLP